MIYVMSDLHGCYEEYIKMLKLINFNENDSLYILGDICDRGPSPMKILLHMMEHDNIIPIYGNHDLLAYPALSKIDIYSKEVLKDRDYAITHNLMNKYEYREYLYWLSDGGRTTLDDYNHLSKVFSTSFLIYLCIGIFIILICETVGLWFVKTKLTIPEERMFSALD